MRQFGLLGPLLAVVLAEVGDRLLLGLLREDLLDRGRRLLQRLLVALRDLRRSAHHVVAELRLDRADQVVLASPAKTASSNAGSWLPFVTVSLPPWSLEPSSVEYCLATEDQLSPSSMAAFARSAVALSFARTMCTSRVSALAELVLVLLVVVGDLLGRRVLGALGDLVDELLLQLLQARLEPEVLHREARVLQGLLEVLLLGVLLLALRLDRLRDLGGRDLDPLVGGLALEPLGGDEQAEGLIAQGRVLGLALVASAACRSAGPCSWSWRRRRASP